MPRSVIDIVVNAKDKASTSLKGVSSNVTGLSGSLTKLGAASVAAGAAIGGAFLAITTKAARAGDELQKMSLRLGIATEDLSELQFAVEQSGGQLADLETGLRRFARAIYEADQGVAEYADSFRRLRLSTRDESGELKSLNDAFVEAADRISRLGNATEQAALAQELFGRGGLTLLPLLKEGAAGIETLKDRAAELGLTLDQDVADDMAAFVDAQNEARRALGAAGREIATVFIPTLIDLATKLANVVSQFREWTAAHPNLVANLGRLAAVLVGAGGVVVGLGAVGALLGPGGAVLGGIGSLSLALGPAAPLMLGLAALAGLWAVVATNAAAAKREMDAAVRAAPPGLTAFGKESGGVSVNDPRLKGGGPPKPGETLFVGKGAGGVPDVAAPVRDMNAEYERSLELLDEAIAGMETWEDRQQRLRDDVLAFHADSEEAHRRRLDAQVAGDVAFWQGQQDRAASTSDFISTTLLNGFMSTAQAGGDIFGSFFQSIQSSLMGLFGGGPAAGLFATLLGGVFGNRGGGGSYAPAFNKRSGLRSGFVGGSSIPSYSLDTSDRAFNFGGGGLNIPGFGRAAFSQGYKGTLATVPMGPGGQTVTINLGHTGPLMGNKADAERFARQIQEILERIQARRA